MLRCKVNLYVLNAVAALFVVSGIAAIGTNAYYLHNNTAQGVFPAFLGLWFSVLIVIFSAQLALRPHFSHVAAVRGCWQTFPSIFYSVLTLIALLIGVGYFVALRADGGVYALVLSALLFLNAFESYASQSQWRDDLSYTALDINHDAALEKIDVAAEDGLGRTSRKWSWCLCLARGANLAIVGLSAFVLSMMLGGAWLQAQGYQMYPPRGRFVDIRVGTGETTRRVHVWCTGPPPNLAQPTIFFDCGGGGHSMSDLWGLQDALNAAGRRVCTCVRGL
jgi:hypothetical protein